VHEEPARDWGFDKVRGEIVEQGAVEDGGVPMCEAEFDLSLRSKSRGGEPDASGGENRRLGKQGEVEKNEEEREGIPHEHSPCEFRIVVAGDEPEEAQSEKDQAAAS
jgi:hypothetical protein